MIRRVKPDRYLKKFREYCKKRYGDNLVAIVLFGSYVWGYFDKVDSDYDTFVILKNEIPSEKKLLNKKFPKMSVQYFTNMDEVMRETHLGHFTSYITLLESGGILYKAKEYDGFLRKLRGQNLFEKAVDVVGFESKFLQKREMFSNKLGFKAAKWALPSIRVGLQLRAFIEKRKLIWDLRKVVNYNKDILEVGERKFLFELNKKVLRRANDFNKKDREMALHIFDKISGEIVLSLKDLVKQI